MDNSYKKDNDNEFKFKNYMKMMSIKCPHGI